MKRKRGEVAKWQRSNDKATKVALGAGGVGEGTGGGRRKIGKRGGWRGGTKGTKCRNNNNNNNGGGNNEEEEEEEEECFPNIVSTTPYKLHSH